MDSKLILAAARGTLDGSLSFPVVVGNPIGIGCSQWKIHITALVLKSVRPDSPDIHL
jgi:hypothetical protein